jgi:cation diffusion facilitator family transporter
MDDTLPLTGPHDHVFGQDRITHGERRTVVVVMVTLVMMVVEIAAGRIFGSMALLADGLHMGSHATALGIAAFAYFYARRRAHDRRYSFGTGKVNALAGYAGAVLLVVFALLMAFESVYRLANPVPISFNQAILVAVIGLAVNGICVFILGEDHDHGEGHEEHDHGHAHGEHDHHQHQDHNLRSAYLHVLADALTSVTAIVALLAGKYLGWNWMDPAMGIVGSLVVARWSAGLLRVTSSVLLDRQAPQDVVDRVRTVLESADKLRVIDLHLWSIGPSLLAAEMTLATDAPRPPAYYKTLLPAELCIAHCTVEVRSNASGGASPAAP